jgi:hypothetical protein
MKEGDKAGTGKEWKGEEGKGMERRRRVKISDWKTCIMALEEKCSSFAVS